MLQAIIRFADVDEMQRVFMPRLLAEGLTRAGCAVGGLEPIFSGARATGALLRLSGGPPVHVRLGHPPDRWLAGPLELLGATPLLVCGVRRGLDVRIGNPWLGVEVPPGVPEGSLAEPDLPVYSLDDLWAARVSRGGDVPKAHWWLKHRGAKIDFTGDQFGGPAVLIELPPSREATAARRVGEALRLRMGAPAGTCFDCAVAAGIMLAAEGVPTRLCRGAVGPGGQYHEESVHGMDFESLAGLLGLD